jgi:hypothetical protein
MESPLGPLSEADRELLGRVALAVARRRMIAPAIVFLESLRPLSYLGSQAMLFLRPFLKDIGSLFLREKTPDVLAEQYERVAAILERREGVEALLRALEAVSHMSLDELRALVQARKSQ